MPDKTKWPDQLFITSTTESEKETNCIKELVTTAIQSNQKSEYSYLLSRYELHKTLRILAWIYRFINNSRKVKKSGPKRLNQKRLNLHKNQEGIYECRGRIEGAYPVYIPSESILSQKIYILCA